MNYEIVELPVPDTINEHNDFLEAFTGWLEQHIESEDMDPNCLSVKVGDSNRIFNLNLYTLGLVSTEFFNPTRVSDQSPIQYLVNAYLLDTDIIRAVDYTIKVDASANVVRLKVDHLDMTYTLEGFNTLQRLFLARVVSKYGNKANTDKLKVNQHDSYTYTHTPNYAEFSPLETGKDE